jgi:hypothetical protein
MLFRVLSGFSVESEQIHSFLLVVCTAIHIVTRHGVRSCIYDHLQTKKHRVYICKAFSSTKRISFFRVLSVKLPVAEGKRASAHDNLRDISCPSARVAAH